MAFDAKKYREENKEELYRKHNIYYETNKDWINERRRLKRLNNPQEARDKQNKYRANNKDKLNRQARERNANNKEKQKISNHNNYIKHKEQRKIYQQGYNDTHKQSIHDMKHNYELSHKDELRVFRDERRLRVKIEVMTHYGNGKCACVKCGNTDIRVLTIDHINGNGAEHRKLNDFARDSRRLYAWLKNNNYPEGYQTLCMNCNWIKRYENNELYKKKEGDV